MVVFCQHTCCNDGGIIVPGLIQIIAYRSQMKRFISAHHFATDDTLPRQAQRVRR